MVSLLGHNIFYTMSKINISTSSPSFSFFQIKICPVENYLYIWWIVSLLKEKVNISDKSL